MSGKPLKKLEEPPPMASSYSSEEEEEDEDAVANSSSEEEEETDSESDAEPVANPKPPADSKKVETSSKKKRSSDTDEVNAKRVKMVSGEDDNKKSSGGGGGGEESKKNCFQRVWSEEDEIAVLQGIIDFKTETGSSPCDDKNALYDLVKKSVSFDVSKTQFMEKIRALKKKFENNLGRGKKKGKGPCFSKDHDRKAFDLAKLVWGDNGIMVLESSSSSARKSKKVEPAAVKKEEEEPAAAVKKEEEEPAAAAVMKEEFVSIVESVTRFGVDGIAAKQGWSRLSSAEKESFEEQWKAVQLEEFKFYSRKSGFIHKVLTKMAEASRPNR